MNFKSDNVVGVCPEIMQAVMDANHGDQSSYFKNDLWLKNAAHANKMAQALAALFKQHGFPIQCPVEANGIFVELPSSLASKLLKQGHLFYEWGYPGSNVYRFVTSCFTTLQEIENFGHDLCELGKKT